MDHAIKPNAAGSATEPGPPAPDPNEDLTGKNLGDYKILRRIGQGGMGQVYLAEQISLKRKVALKILKPALAANKNALDRFQLEAESVAKVTHANIVQVYAIGDVGGIYFMALEFVEGRNLREFLEKKGTPEVLLGLSIMRQVAAALQRASEFGVIHRDIKPENILLTRKGEAKVADFGLARVLSESENPAPHLTQSNVTMGTPLYMSPEQVEGKKAIDHRTDIYSFGVTCYHMFAGHPPFRGTAPFEVAVQHVQKEPQPLGEIRPDLPAELCGIIHKMMAKAPEARYQMGREIVREVAWLRDRLVGASQVLAVPGTPLPFPNQLDAPSTLTLPRPQPARWPGRLLLAAIPVAVAGGLLVGWLRSHSPAPVPTVPVAFPDEPGPAAKAALSQKEREKLLLALIQEQSNKTDNLNVAAGLRDSIELAILYLKDTERLNEADLFFKELSDKPIPAYKLLGKLGKAMVLAFKDQPDASNQLFVAILDKDKGEKENRANFWKSNPAFRERLARALAFNLQNSPATFPERLKIYLHPPAPTLKTP